MRGFIASASLAAIVLCVPALAVAQEAAGLCQTVTIEDPFADARVPVAPPAFVQQPAARNAEAEQRRSDEAAGIGVNTAETTTQTSRSEFDRGADLEVTDEFVLAYSGYDSINREAEDRRRLSLLAATGQLPPAEDEQPGAGLLWTRIHMRRWASAVAPSSCFPSLRWAASTVPT